MAQLVLSNRFGFQPQYPAPLDASNPFAKDIKLAYSVGRGLQDGAHGLGSVTGTMTYGTGPKGRRVRPSDGTSYIAFADNPDYNIVGGVTAFALIEVGGTTVQQHILSKSSGGGGSDTPWAFGLETGGYIFLNRANAGFRVWQSGTALTTGQIVVIAATQGADISVAPKFYVNGILDGVSSTSLYGGSGTGAPNVNTNPVRVGNRADLASQFFGWLYEGDVLNRVLSASEVAALSANLYAIWQAPARRLWAVPAATGSAGTSSGSAFVTGVGASIASSAGASSGVGAASGVGASTASTVGSSAGVATVSGVGTSSTGSLGSSSGTSTVNGVGSSTAASVGSSNGTASVSGSGASTASTVGSSAGVATVSGVGDSSQAGSSVGSASGSSSVLGVGASIAASVGLASGASSASGVSPAPVSTGGHYAGVAYTGKRPKRDLIDRDREDIKQLIRGQLKEVRAEIIKAEVPQEVKEQARAVIKPLQQSADVQALQSELVRVRQMLHMWEQQVKREREEDEELLFLFH